MRYSQLKKKLDDLSKQVLSSDAPKYIKILRTKIGYEAILPNGKSLFGKSEKKIYKKLKKKVGKRNIFCFLDLREDDENPEPFDYIPERKLPKQKADISEPKVDTLQPTNNPPSKQCNTCRSWAVFENEYKCTGGIKNVKTGARCVGFLKR